MTSPLRQPPDTPLKLSPNPNTVPQHNAAVNDSSANDSFHPIIRDADYRKRLRPVADTDTRSHSLATELTKMRPLSILAGALALTPAALAVDIQKSVLVTYNREAPRLTQMIDDAKGAILSAGGKITHEFKFIK